MPKYVYKVKDSSTGEEEVAQTEAVSKDALVKTLHEKNKTVISVTEMKPGQKQEKSLLSFNFSDIKFLFGVSLREKINFCRQLAALLEGGLTLDRSLSILIQQIENKKFRNVMNEVKEDVRKGNSLHDAFGEHPKMFSPLWVNLVETGEASGELPFVFRELANYFQLSQDIKSKITTALIYPAIVILATGIAIGVFVTFLVPMFSQLFKSFDTPMPFLTKLVIDGSAFVNSNKWYILFIIVGVCIGVYKYINSSKGRKVFDKFKLSLPLMGEFFLQVAILRFVNSLSVLLKGGVPILYSLEVVKRSVNNTVIQDVLDKVKKNVRKGEGMGKSLEESDLIPSQVIQMIEVGEETGDMGTMLDKLTDYYREQIDIFVTRFSTMIEPILIIFVGTIVAFLVAALFMPIFMRASLSGI